MVYIKKSIKSDLLLKPTNLNVRTYTPGENLYFLWLPVLIVSINFTRGLDMEIKVIK